MEDMRLECKKQSQVAEDLNAKSSSSSSSKCRGEQEKVTKSEETMESDVQRHVRQASPAGDADGSEVEEEDVKVCDICGDAGREDLLAVCSRCSDGAEHTYCMREMLDKVPGGDWVCEECKINEELEARKLEHSKVLVTSERSKYVGRTGSINYDISHKLESKDPTCEPNKTKPVTLTKQTSSKRPGDSIESGVLSKKQARESSIVSPKMSAPGLIGALPKDSFFKNLDNKTKRKSTNQISSGTESTSDSSENVRSPTTSSLHAVKGNFLKSNSFSSANSKPNIKVPDEGSQKQKLGADAKDGPGKLIGKSVSFKGLARSNVSEPKVKMLPSPKCPPVEELKCQKQARDRISFERKSTIKLDHSFVGPTPTAANDNNTKRPFRGDNASTCSTSNNGDVKNAQTDGKLLTMSKHTLHSGHKSSDFMAGPAEVTRQLSTGVCGSVFVNGTSSSSSEVKSNYVSVEGSTTSLSRAADKSCLGGNGAKADSLDDNSIGRRAISSDASVSRAKDGINEENKLKAALEAAMQKKHVFKKHRASEKPVELSVSNTLSNDGVSNQTKDALHHGNGVLGDRVSNSCHHISTGAKHPHDFSISSVEEVDTIVSAIPVQESVWQGSLEIHRNGRLPDTCSGFQAHLSNFASEKVLQVVKKFPHKLVLDEVMRPSAWPVKFKEVGAHEDNIALYFFAKDLDSYVRSYKILLDYLMKHDLALRGDIDGVELLVFPSNQLPDKSQCWNGMFYMWGVFRRRKSHVDRRSGSLERPDMFASNLISQNKIATSSANPSENPSLHRLAVEESSVSGSGLLVSGCEASSVSVASSPNGDSYNQHYQVGRTTLSGQTFSKDSLNAANDHSQPSVAQDRPQSPRSALKDQVDCSEENNICIDGGNHLLECKKATTFSPLDKEVMSCHTSMTIPPVAEKEVKCDSTLKQEHGCAEEIKKDAVEVKPEGDRKQEGEEIDNNGRNSTGRLQLEGGFKQERCVDINISAEINMEDSDVHSTEPRFEYQKSSWMDDNEDASKCEGKTNTSDRTDGGGFKDPGLELPCSLDGRLAAEMCGASTSSCVNDTINRVDNEKSTSGSSPQRYFFIVDSHLTQTQSPQLEGDAVSWKVDSSENEDRRHDGSPNLELALGVESRKAILPFFAGIVDKNDPPDIATEKDDEDASASLSLSLAFPFSDKEKSTRIERPTANAEQLRHEVTTPLLLFRGSSGK